MCLAIDEKRDKNFRVQNKNKKWVNVYKVYYRSEYKELFPIFYSKNTGVKAGWVKSNRENKELSSDELHLNRVDKGIHVYLSKKAAYYWYSRIDKEVIVKCKALVKDLLRCGVLNEAAFMKIWLPKEELKKAVSKK